MKERNELRNELRTSPQHRQLNKAVRHFFTIASEGLGSLEYAVASAEPETNREIIKEYAEFLELAERIRQMLEEDRTPEH
jgi:hypothetical protein